MMQALVEAATKPESRARGLAIHNALMLSVGKDMPPTRATGIRAYILGMLEIPLTHVDGPKPIMTRQELVTVFLAAALFVQADRILAPEIM